MKKRALGALALFAALGLSACVTNSETKFDLFGDALSGEKLERAIVAASVYPLGSEQNPVRANMPAGERAYLERLRCSDGNAPAFNRGGSVGTGPYGTILDVYSVECLNVEPKKASVFMDMYHDHVEERPVPGFTINGA